VPPTLFVLKRDRMCEAIALAEGYLAKVDGALVVNPHRLHGELALPVRCNNPGDLEVGDLGHGTVAKKTRFSTPDAGWSRLRSQVTLILTGRSHAGYELTDNFLELANRYTGGDAFETWALAVAQHCGMEPMQTLSQYVCVPIGLLPEFKIPECAPPRVQTPAPGELL
jgi:hypothetical protein